MATLKRKLAVTALALAATAGGIELLASANLRREQAARAYLGDKLYVRSRGEGAPIVFLAGLQASTEFWQDRFDALDRDHRLIFVDAHGFGHSPWPDLRYTLEDHLGALRRTLVAQGATSHVTIVAHSLGTIFAANYAARYPGEIDRVVLLGTPVFSGEKEARKRLWQVSPLAAMFSLHWLLARETCMTMGAFRPLLRRVLPSLEPDLPRGVVSDAVLHCWPAIDGTLRNVLLAKPIAVPLRRIGPKVTFIHGSADAVTPLPQIRRLAGEIGARLLVTANDHRRYVLDSHEEILGALETTE